MVDLKDEEIIMIDIMISARKVQDFLWSDVNINAGLEEFRRMLRKRLAKIEEINPDNPYWTIEMKKRLLQTACICVNLINQLNKRDVPDKGNVVSNLPQYNKKVKE